MSEALDLSAEDRQCITQILRAVLPTSACVWVFGSRVQGTVRRGSDLDLAIEMGRPITLGEMALLREAFEDSALAYRVDLLDWHSLSPDFQARIHPYKVAFPL